MPNSRSSSTPWRVLSLLLVALASAFGVAATHQFFVMTARGQQFDEGALQQATLMTGGRLEGFTSQLLDALPASSVVVAVVVVGLVAAAQHRWWHAAIATLATLVANFGTQFLKNVVFDRPDVGVETLLSNSMPSGHTTLAASSAAAIFLVVTPRWRPVVGLLGGLFTFIAGSSTVVNLWHRPADVVAALLVVGTTTAVAAMLISILDARSAVARKSTSAGSALWIIFSALLALGCAAAAFLIPQLPPGALSRSGSTALDTRLFWSGVGLIGATNFAVLFLLQLLLPRRAGS